MKPQHHDHSPVVYVPFDGVQPDDAVRAGASWLAAQPGSRLVLLPLKQNYKNNLLLPRLTARACVETPRSLGASTWWGGPILAPWPSKAVLSALSEGRATRASSICVVMRGSSAEQAAWLMANQAVDLTTGAAFGTADDLALHPVVTVAMQRLGESVNHANALTTSYDRDAAIVTLQRLHAAGYPLDPDRLYAWALSNGFHARGADRLKDFATKVRAGHRFRIQDRTLRDDIVATWEAEAHDEQESRS